MLGRQLALIALAILASTPAMAERQKLLLELCVNGSCYGTAFVILQDGHVFVDADSLGRAEIPLQGPPAFSLEAQDFVDVSAISYAGGVDVDSARGRLALALPGAVFAGNSIDVTAQPRRLVPDALLSAFMNYGLNTGFGSDSASVFLDTGIAYGPALLRDDPSWTARQGFARGLTRFEFDDTANDRRWTLGDQYAYSNDGLGGTALIGGIGLARAFDLDPYLITYPQPTISGLLQAPGTVDIYENGALVSQKQVPAGPFNLASLGLGLGAGAGNVRVVVQDPFGGTSVLQQNFYSSSQLLRQGLSDYAYQLGVERLSSLSNGYETGRPVLLARDSTGVTNFLTAGARLEVEGRLVNAGPTINLRLPVGVLTAGLSASASAAGQGLASLIAYAFNSRLISVGAGMQTASSGYRRIGDDILPAAFRPQQIAYANLSTTPFAPLNLQLSAGRSVYADGSRQSNVSLNAQINLPHGATLTLSLSRAFNHPGRGDTQITANLVIPWGRTSVGLSATRDESGGTAYDLSAQRSLPPDTGFGYTANAELGRSGFTGNGQAAYQSPYGLLQLTGQRIAGQTSGAALLSGSLVAMDGRVFATRETQDGYALIETPGAPGTRITHENQPIGTTDADGNLLVTNLLPYQANKIGLDQDSVPLDDAIDATDQTVTVPRFGGTIARFGVHRLHAARGVLMLGGTPAQYGAGKLEAPGGTLKTLIGLDGTFYFPNLPAGRFTLKARTANGDMDCPLTMPASPRPLTDLGRIACQPGTATP